MAPDGLRDDVRYEAYWGYLRHIETLRFQLAAVIAVVAGGVMGWVFRGPGHLDDALADDGSRGWAVLLLGVFVGAAGCFLCGHKVNYSLYHRLVRALDSDVEKLRPWDVFPWLLLMLSVVQVGAGWALSRWAVGGRWLWVVPGVFVLGWWVWYGWVYCCEKRSETFERAKGKGPCRFLT